MSALVMGALGGPTEPESEAAAIWRRARAARNALFDRAPSDWTLDELAAELETRYAPTVIPPCAICGGPLSMQACGGGEPTRWACSPMEDDPDRPGHGRYKPDRGLDEHYSQSVFVDRRQGGDELVIEALRRLRTPAPPVDRPSRPEAGEPAATALANLRHLYQQLLLGVADQPGIARGLLGPAIETLERALGRDGPVDVDGGAK